eukprot:281958-Rhodomonas_salina.1
MMLHTDGLRVQYGTAALCKKKGSYGTPGMTGNPRHLFVAARSGTKLARSFRALCRSRAQRRGLAPTACRAAQAAERVIAPRWRRVSAFRALRTVFRDIFLRRRIHPDTRDVFSYVLLGYFDRSPRLCAYLGTGGTR